MAFTDDNLKQLRNLLNDQQASGFFTEDMARGILNRLEAAEACKDMTRAHSHCTCQLCYSSEQEWRKAAGR